MGNDISPGFAKVHYTSTLAEHIMTIPVDPFLSVGGTWYVNAKNTIGGLLWSTAISTMLAVLKTEISTTSTFTYAELFTKAVGAAPVFVDTFAYNVAGTGGATISASQINFGYRDSVGGHGRIVLTDQIEAVNSKFRGPAYGNAAKLAIVNYMIGTGSMIFSRKGGYPINVPQILTKTNDVLRKKYGIS